VLFLEGFRAYDIERYNNPNIDAAQLISGVRGQFTVS